eukprot:CAMPEP_0194297378 /NCGR_PEP_ID=MMETSP0169-20130528/58730_1 /TAXON_ID=218684 /ORGANISM="Corethron pennatum, Strain L29A3" /LENGTH=296 /DNA_ID=CAMNT_0039047163 /DNA_START=168 /DNA_END=1058 /DNA_ORIENTATION=-
MSGTKRRRTAIGGGDDDNDVAARNGRGRAAGKKKVAAARARGVAIINQGAGAPPVDAHAPFGGQRYTLLVDGEDAPSPTFDASLAHDGRRRHPTTSGPDAGKLLFEDAPQFTPLLTPAECIRAGIFGGCYFNPRGGKAGIFGREVDVDWREFPAEWFEGLDIVTMVSSRRYCVSTNKYGVKAGQDQAFWEGKGWIHERDPRGWFQWYCRFYMGRRCADDARQIKRWQACASGRGRWRNQLCGRVLKASDGGTSLARNRAISPVIRQTLLHWAYELTEEDYALWLHQKQQAVVHGKN